MEKVTSADENNYTQQGVWRNGGTEHGLSCGSLVNCCATCRSTLPRTIATAPSPDRYVPLCNDTLKMTKTFFILTLFTLTTLVSCGQTKLNKKVVVETLDFAYLDGCET